jgi:uncharacterized protein (DUF885 family)
MGQKPVGELYQLAQAYYRSRWQRWPTEASRLGLQEYDAQLEIPDASLYEEELDHVRQTLRQFQLLEPPTKGTTDWLDARAFEAALLLEELFLDRVAVWRANPAAPLERFLGSLFHLLMRRSVESSDVVEAIVHRLSRLPDYVRALQKTVTEPVRRWVEAARQAAEGAFQFLESALLPLGARHPRLATMLHRSVEDARVALESYVDWLRDLTQRLLREDPAVGEATLRTIVRVEHGLDDSLEELEEFGRKQVAFFEQQLEEAAARLDPAKSWSELLFEARRAFAARHQDLLSSYRQTTAWLRAQLLERQILVLPPREECLVLETPPFLRPFVPTAAYSAPGPFESVPRGLFYVSVPSPELPDSERRAQVEQHFGLESTCVHEAYPGHHVQLCWANLAPSIPRKLAHHMIFVEGWTLYCEQLAEEIGLLSDPLLHLEYLHSQLWRAYRILIDIGVHTRRLSCEEGVQLLQDRLAFTTARAQAELNWYSESPGTPMSYLLGKYETLKLREQYAQRHPSATLRDFHCWLLSFGSLPQRWLREVLWAFSAPAGGSS